MLSYLRVFVYFGFLNQYLLWLVGGKAAFETQISVISNAIFISHACMYTYTHARTNSNYNYWRFDVSQVNDPLILHFSWYNIKNTIDECIMRQSLVASNLYVIVKDLLHSIKEILHDLSTVTYMSLFGSDEGGGCS